VHVVVEAPCQEWGVDFIGEFKDKSSNRYHWILIATNYFTRWVEAIPMKKETKEVVMNFLEERIITVFGTPANITTNNTKAFSSLALEELCFKYRITLSHSLNYYPQGNGLEKSSNKNLMNIFKKIVGENKKAWDSKIKYALWEYHIATKTSMEKSPFELVYGLNSKFPMNFQIPILHFAQHYMKDKEALWGRIKQLVELDQMAQN